MSTPRIKAEPEVIALVDVLRGLSKTGKVRMDRQHGETHLCPTCREDMMRIGITDLAYTFEVCECGDPTYAHLVEQLWHRTCLVATTAEATA